MIPEKWIPFSEKDHAPKIKDGSGIDRGGMRADVFT
jgi:hypothetical protein